MALSVTLCASASAGENDLRAIVDSRGESQLALSGGVNGVNCELARGGASAGHLADGTLAFGERLDVCPWSVGALDMRLSEDVLVGYLPRLSDAYLVAEGAPYEHIGYSADLTLFDIINAFGDRITESGGAGEKPHVSLKKLVRPQADRVFPAPVWMRYSRTTQDGRSLLSHDWGFAVFRYQHMAGAVDMFVFDFSAVAWGDGFGISPLTISWFRVHDMPLGPFTIDAAAGFAAAGPGKQSNPQFMTTTPESLGNHTEFDGKLQVRSQIGILDWTGGVEHTLSPFLADGLVVDTRVNMGATVDLGVVDRLGVSGWAARSELISADGSDVQANTWGAAVGAGVRLGHRFRFDVDGEIGRSFYARLGGAPAVPSLGAMVTASLSARFGL
jgi:hypothetical protein